MRTTRIAIGSIAVLAVFIANNRCTLGEPVPAITSLSLTEAIEMALTEYPGIGVAEAQAEQAHAAAKEATAAWLPSLSFSASATQYEEPMPVTPIHSFTPGTFPQFGETMAQYGLHADYSLFEGGRRVARIRQARSHHAAAEASLRQTRQTVTARVITAYLNILSRREILVAHDHRTAALQAELSRVEQFYERERAAQVEILRVEAVLAGAQADRVRAQAALEVAERELALLVGTDVNRASADRLMRIVLADSTVKARDLIVSKALQSNPAVEQAQRNSAATWAGLAVARSERWPRLQLVGNWFDQGDFEGNRVNEWNAGALLSFPLFTGGAVNKRIARARANYAAAEEQLNLTGLQIKQEIDRALAALNAAHARVVSLIKAVDSFTEVVRIEKLLLQTGSGTQTDYLDTEADLVAARANLIEARHGEITARVKLARITGELDIKWISRYLENQP